MVLADQNKARAERIIAGHPNGKAMELDVQGEHLRRHVAADMVVSLLPWTLHPMSGSLVS